MTRYGIEDLLNEFGSTASSITPLNGGAVNEHWRVEADGRPLVLRRYNPRHNPAGIPYEHQVLGHMAARGWPVAAPIPALNGRTLLEIEGSRYALFPFLPGSPAPFSRALLEEKGRLLARLHRDLASAPVSGQRPGFGRVTELDAWLAPDRFFTLDALLAWTRRGDPALANAIRRECELSQEELHRLGFNAIPDTVVHFEFYRANLLFEQRKLSAVLDFDFVHQDAAVSDIGRSVAIECMADGRIISERLACFVTGYLHELPLSEPELELVIPAIRANLLWLAVLPLSLWASGGPATYLLPSARHAALVQLPALRDDEQIMRDALTTAVRAAHGSR